MRLLKVFLILMILASAALAVEFSAINPEELSLKAGPTEPGEELSILWLESFVFPKTVNDERIVSLGVKLTSKVDSVIAKFDFNDQEIPLVSRDSFSWHSAYQIPDEVSAGLHLARYTITTEKGSIQRTLDFFVEDPSGLVPVEENIAQGEVVEAREWPLTVTTTCAALVGGSSRILYVGQGVVGLSKVPWYKVVFEDGEEGWVPASMVKEPTDDYYRLGYEAYCKKEYVSAIEHYKTAVAINPEFVKGYFWLSKSYFKLNDLNAAYHYIRQANALNDRDISIKILSNVLAHKFFTLAHENFKTGKYHSAVANYQRVLELKPSSTTSWIEMGHCYSKLDFPLEARSAWKEALKVDPENKVVYALLDIDFDPRVLTQLSSRPKEEGTIASLSEGLPPVLADDSLCIVKENTTKKGTKVESAIRSVISLTRSLGTPVIEKGWAIKKNGEKYLVAYICEQGKGALETFEWLVDVDTRHVTASNANAQLLMGRW